MTATGRARWRGDYASRSRYQPMPRVLAACAWAVLREPSSPSPSALRALDPAGGALGGSPEGGGGGGPWRCWVPSTLDDVKLAPRAAAAVVASACWVPLGADALDVVFLDSMRAI